MRLVDWLGPEIGRSSAPPRHRGTRWSSWFGAVSRVEPGPRPRQDLVAAIEADQILDLLCRGEIAPVRREVGDTRHVWEGDDTANLGADAELQLRGQDPPIALVMNELKAMFALAKEISERIRAGPTLREMFESELRDELESIARKLLDPKAKS